MKQSFRTAALTSSALLMIFGAAGYAIAVVPDLHGDLVEIGVRPTVLGGTVLSLYFSAIAMFGFALMVSAAAIRAMRGGTAVDRLTLAIIAVIYTAFGTMAFARSHNPHHLGPVLMGVLLGAALAVPDVKHRRVGREL